MDEQKEKIILDALYKLKNVYAKIPETTGCMEHIAKPPDQGGCNGFCCRIQQPQVLYVEFLNAWRHIMANWSYEDIINIVESAIKDYVDNSPTKGCIFFDKESMMCRVHDKRPLVCFLYGITPEEEYKPRLERLRILYQGTSAVFRDQCKLVKTIDGKSVTKEDTDRWWKQIVAIEETFVNKENIHDEVGGSYRRFSEHILLHLFSDETLNNFQILRVHGNDQEKRLAIMSFMAVVKKKIQSILEEFEK